MKTEAQLVEEQERTFLLLQTKESRIRNFIRIYADDEYDLAALISERDILTGRLAAIKWVRGLTE